MYIFRPWLRWGCKNDKIGVHLPSGRFIKHNNKHNDQENSENHTKCDPQVFLSDRLDCFVSSFRNICYFAAPGHTLNNLIRTLVPYNARFPNHLFEFKTKITQRNTSIASSTTAEKETTRIATGRTPQLIWQYKGHIYPVKSSLGGAYMSSSHCNICTVFV